MSSQRLGFPREKSNKHLNQSELIQGNILFKAWQLEDLELIRTNSKLVLLKDFAQIAILPQANLFT